MGLLQGSGPPGPKEPDSGRKPGSCSSSGAGGLCCGLLELGVFIDGDKGLCLPLCQAQDAVSFLGLILPQHSLWAKVFHCCSPCPPDSISSSPCYPDDVGSTVLQAPGPAWVSSSPPPRTNHHHPTSSIIQGPQGPALLPAVPAALGVTVSAHLAGPQRSGLVS